MRFLFGKGVAGKRHRSYDSPGATAYPRKAEPHFTNARQCFWTPILRLSGVYQFAWQPNHSEQWLPILCFKPQPESCLFANQPTDSRTDPLHSVPFHGTRRWGRPQQSLNLFYSNGRGCNLRVYKVNFFHIALWHFWSAWIRRGGLSRVLLYGTKSCACWFYWSTSLSSSRIARIELLCYHQETAAYTTSLQFSRFQERLRSHSLLRH